MREKDTWFIRKKGEIIGGYNYWKAGAIWDCLSKSYSACIYVAYTAHTLSRYQINVNITYNFLLISWRSLIFFSHFILFSFHIYAFIIILKFSSVFDRELNVPHLHWRRCDEVPFPCDDKLWRIWSGLVSKSLPNICMYNTFIIRTILLRSSAMTLRNICIDSGQKYFDSMQYTPSVYS